MSVLRSLLAVVFPLLVVSLSYHENGHLRTVPLKALVVTGEFFDCLGEVVVKQTWVNDASTPITSNYKFSLDGEAVVSGFHMSIGENKWVGAVKEKNQAQQQFNAAVSAGVKSSLLEKISDNDYQVQIGPIASYETATIEFRYLTRVSVKKDGSYHFVLPTNIAPKYSPSTANQADIEYARKMGTIPYANQPAYKFEVDLTWRSGSALQEIVSPTNAIRTEVLSPKAVRVHCSTAPANGDFSLVVRTAQSTGAYLYAKEDGTRYLYVHNQIPAVKSTPTPKTITVVLDRSGSMGGNKIVQAVKAVDEFLSLLQEDASTLLNIVSFGSHHSALYSHPVPATAGNIAQMRHLVRSFRADFGGTELLDCLTDVVRNEYGTFGTRVSQPEFHSTREHVVVLLTDGQVSNRNVVTEMLSKNAKGVRIMTIGIGRDADRELVQEVADATYGISRVLVDELDLTAALQDVLGYIDKQYYTDVRLLGHEVTQVSRVLYPAHPVDLFLRLDDAQLLAAERDGLSVTATDPVRGGAKVWPIAVKDCVQVGDLLEKLYANHVITELSKKVDGTNWHSRSGAAEEAKNMIVKLSVAHGIMNKHTSFLVISDQRIHRSTVKDVRNVEVPHHAGEMGTNAAHGRASRSASAFPSGIRSFVPTADPSSVPTCMPSAAPTLVPTAAPSSVPSGVPSAQPSGIPTVVPSAVPSVVPSVVPSAVPASVPAAGPVFAPSAVPASVPVCTPSAVPTVVPSALPTFLPTVPRSAAATNLMDTARGMLGGAAGASSVLLQPGQTLNVNADGSTNAQSIAPELSLEARMVELALRHGAPLPYYAAFYQLLQYASQAALEEDAARAALSPEMFFNVGCLLRLRKAALWDKAVALGLLEAYVKSVVADLKVAEVATMLGL
jgi:Ca-activated chloride channel family protein